MKDEGILNFLSCFLAAALMDLINRVFRQFMDQFLIVFVDDMIIYSLNSVSGY